MKFEINWKGKEYCCEWKEETNFEDLGSEINGVIGFIFDEDDKVCIVNCEKDQGWTFPGGGIEENDENFEDALIREVDEEADLDIEGIRRIGYVSGYPKGEEDNKDYTLRFAARVKKKKKQTVDPATGEIPKRKFVFIKDAFNYVKWDSNGREQLACAFEVLK